MLPCSSPQVVKEYTGKVDTLVAAKQEAAVTQATAAKEEEAAQAARNAYQTLMPLALPAPNMGGEAFYNAPQASAFPYGAPGGGFGGQPGQY